MSLQIDDALWRWPAVASLPTTSATSFSAPLNLTSFDDEAVPHALTTSAAAMTRRRRIAEECSSALAGLRRPGLQAQRAAAWSAVAAAVHLEAHDLADRVRGGQPDLEPGPPAERALEQLG